MFQVFQGNAGVITNATRYYYVDGTSLATTVVQFRSNYIAAAGTLSNLQVDLTTAPGVGTSRIFTVMLNRVATALAVTISGTNTSGTDTAHNINVSAGDEIALRGEITGTPAASGGRWGSEFACTTPQQAVWGTSVSEAGSDITRYAVVGSSGLNSYIFTNETDASMPWGLPCTITALAVQVEPAPGAGNSRTYDLMVNGVAVGSTATIADAATETLVTGLSIAINPLDLISIRQIPVNTPAGVATHSWGVAYTPQTDGQWNVSGRTDNDYTDGQFIGINSAGILPNSTELLRSESGASAVNGLIYSNFYVKIQPAPGVSKSRTYTIRLNGVSTALTVTLGAADTSAQIAGTVTAAVNDYFSVLLNGSGSFTAPAWQKWTIGVGENRPHKGGGGGKPPPSKKDPRGRRVVDSVRALLKREWWNQNQLTTIFDAGLKGRITNVDLPPAFYERRTQPQWEAGQVTNTALELNLLHRNEANTQLPPIFFDPWGKRDSSIQFRGASPPVFTPDISRSLQIDTNPSDVPAIDTNPSDAPIIDTNPSDSPSLEV